MWVIFCAATRELDSGSVDPAISGQHWSKIRMYKLYVVVYLEYSDQKILPCGHIMSSTHWRARNFGSVNSACLFPGEAKLQEFEDEHPELLESPWKDPPFFHLQVQVSQYKIGSVQMPWDHSSLGIAWCWHCMRPHIQFSPMHGEGFLFLSGVMGVEVCSLEVAFSSETVPNKGSMAMPSAIATKAVTGRGLERHATSFCVAGMALRDIPRCLTPACCVSNPCFLWWCRAYGKTAKPLVLEVFGWGCNVVWWQLWHFVPFRCCRWLAVTLRSFAWQAWHSRHWAGPGGATTLFTQLFHTQIFHIQLCHTHLFHGHNSFTHNFVTYNSLLHTCWEQSLRILMWNAS